MKSITTIQAQKVFHELIEEIAKTHEPIQIIGKTSNGILLNEKDWNAIQETLYLTSIPGMQKSIEKGLKIPLQETSDKLKF